MGHINFRPGALPGVISEIVGYKSGLALQLDELVERAGSHGATLQRSLSSHARLHSMEYEELVSSLLYSVGRLKSPSRDSPTLALYLKYRNDSSKLNAVQELTSALVSTTASQHQTVGPIDLTPLAHYVADRNNPTLAKLFGEFHELLQDYLVGSPISSFRTVEWRDTIELDRLFDSESLDVSHGSYIDQRFIDFLERNNSALASMNWRKFEGLTAEFFTREGYKVEIGPGRGDDGVDIRVWTTHTASPSPPTILVQCKREQRKIGKVVVKALWADVVNAGAQSGMVVTTTCLSPGAQKVCQARSYPIAVADRITIEKWLTHLRTPYAGVFMAS